MNDTNWTDLFIQNLINRYMPKKCKYFNWKVFHGLVNTEVKLRQMNFSDGIMEFAKYVMLVVQKI